MLRMTHAFKKAGIPRTGFEYQDLIGIELLIAFYRDPSLYSWVKLEAEDTTFGGLDDIVACRANGSLDLLQVKFTSDPGEHPLDWDWLLERKGRGTSRLAKWALSLEQTGKLGTVNSASLRTNRIPTPEFAAALVDRRIDLSRINSNLRSQIETDLGGAEVAARFFAQFVFSHSELLVDELESNLMGRLVPTDTDTSGWLLLREQARRWASRKLEPAPDGFIRHQHLVQIITKKRPKPIPQDFVIPDVYCEPSAAFTNSFLDRTSANNISILWGSPGRGKSTYLSWLVEEMHKREMPVVRHHYFLTLSDASSDRYSVTSIASSLIDQMVVRYGDAVRGLTEDTDRLRDWITACAANFAKQQKRFTIVIDGLDHVWREQGDAIHLNHLFNALLPLPDNVSLIVGTQRVPDAQLPARLLRHSGVDDWIEIPAMDAAAVHRWVEGQSDAGRVIFGDDSADGVPELAQAFYAISHGHPLHLIYSFEMMVRAGQTFTAEAIGLLPPCPDGDIRQYYRSLWARLSSQAREIIHLIAGSPFHWPSLGLRLCVGPTDDVDHLLEQRRSGVAPFHGSILAFVREQPDHSDAYKALIPATIGWLETQAPEFWRWGWLWIMRAANGDSTDLTQRTTREWVRTSLVAGWPREQIVNILTHAERATFETADYARTMELRSLKTRLLNVELQMEKSSEFEATAIRLAGNVQHVLSLADAIPTLPDARIVTLARASPPHAFDIRAECLQELRRRVNVWITLRHKPQNEFIALTQRFLDVLALAPTIEVPTLARFLAGFREGSDIVEWAIECLTRERRLDTLLALDNEFGKVAKLKRIRSRVHDGLVRVAAFEGIDLKQRFRSRAACSPLLDCWRRYHGGSLTKLAQFSVSKSSNRRGGLESALHDCFFRTLSHRLAGLEPPSYEAVIPATDGDWLSAAFENLRATASAIANGDAQLSFSTPYFHAAGMSPIEQRGDARDHYFAFKTALRAIAIDLHCLKSPIGKTPTLYREEVDAARASPHWVEELWLDDQIRQRLTLWDAKAVQTSIDAAASKESATITPFNERVDKWTDLARLSELHGLTSAYELLNRAAECVLGYGWRKDLWADDVLDAIVDVHSAATGDALALLTPLVPIIDKITEFTDGDETDHVRSTLIRTVASVCPDRLPNFYRHHLHDGEFRYADETLDAFLKLTDFTTPEAKALASTLLDRRTIGTLLKLGQTDPAPKTLAEAQMRFLGGMPVSHEREYGSTPETERDPPPDFRLFEPKQFGDLLSKASALGVGFQARRQCLRDWLAYWRGRGKGLDAIRAIDEYYQADNNPTNLDDLLDDVFDASLELQGRDAAYVWLVRAHVHRYGWSHWYGGQDALTRLERAAAHYSDRWQRYVQDASRQTEFWQKRGRDEFTFGARYLVRFLLRVGQVDRAVALMRACVDIVCEEVSDQPIPEARWFSQ